MWVGVQRITMGLECCHGPSTARPGAPNFGAEEKSRVTPVGMTDEEERPASEGGPYFVEGL